MPTFGRESRKAAWLGRIAIVIFPFAILGGMEGCARLFSLKEKASASMLIPSWIGNDHLARQNVLKDLVKRPDLLRKFYHAYRPDRYLFYRMKPNLDVEMEDVLSEKWKEELRWRLTTNRKGYRGKVYPVGRNPGTLRVACLGDSSTYGWGLGPGESYPAAIERTLAWKFPDGRFEILNFGVPGYNTFQGRVLLEREVLAYRPDIIVIAYGANDLSKVRQTTRERYEAACSFGGGLRYYLGMSHAYVAMKAVLLNLSGRNAKDRFAVAKASNQGGMIDVSDKEYGKLLEKMAALSAGAGSDVFFVGQCLSNREGGRLHIMKDVAHRLDRPFLPIMSLEKLADEWAAKTPALDALAVRHRSIFDEKTLKENPRMRYLLPDLCHPSAFFSEVIGRELIDIFRQYSPNYQRYIASLGT